MPSLDLPTEIGVSYYTVQGLCKFAAAVGQVSRPGGRCHVFSMTGFAICTLLCLQQVLMRQRELGLAQIAGTSDMAIDGHPPLPISGPVLGN